MSEKSAFLELKKRREKFFTATWTYFKRRNDRGKSTGPPAPPGKFTIRDTDKFVGGLIGMTSGTMQNIRLGRQNLSGEGIEKLREVLGGAACEISPEILGSKGLSIVQGIEGDRLDDEIKDLMNIRSRTLGQHRTLISMQLYKSARIRDLTPKERSGRPKRFTMRVLDAYLGGIIGMSAAGYTNVRIARRNLGVVHLQALQTLLPEESNLNLKPLTIGVLIEPRKKKGI